MKKKKNKAERKIVFVIFKILWPYVVFSDA